MTAFTLNIETDNAAFEEGQEQEVVRILEHVTQMVSEGFTSEPILLDTNGNRVGSWELELPVNPHEED